MTGLPPSGIQLVLQAESDDISTEKERLDRIRFIGRDYNRNRAIRLRNRYLKLVKKITSLQIKITQFSADAISLPKKQSDNLSRTLRTYMRDIEKKITEINKVIEKDIPVYEPSEKPTATANLIASFAPTSDKKISDGDKQDAKVSSTIVDSEIVTSQVPMNLKVFRDNTTGALFYFDVENEKAHNIRTFRVIATPPNKSEVTFGDDGPIVDGARIRPNAPPVPSYDFTFHYELNSLDDEAYRELISTSLLNPHDYLTQIYQGYRSEEIVVPPELVVNRAAVARNYETNKYNLLGGPPAAYANAARLQRLRRKYGILRSYIDVYHDFLHHGQYDIERMMDFIVARYEAAGATEDDVGDQSLSNKRNIIRTFIFTRSGNVSQERCQQITLLLLEEYAQKRKELNDPYSGYVTTKSQAYVMDASIGEPAEINTFIGKLQANGITQIAVESMMMSVKDLFRGMTFVDTQSGLFDAGSGVGVKKAVDEGGANPQVVFITRQNVTNTKSFEGKNHTKNELPYTSKSSTSMFLYGDLTFQIGLDKNNVLLTEMGGGGGSNEIGTTQIVSVNSLASYLGIGRIRGSGGTFTSSLITTGSLTNRSNAIALKTWTDYIQIVDYILADSRAETNTAVIISDKLCEMIGMFLGDGHHILVEGGKLIYYCYNMNRVGMTAATITTRYRLLNFLKNNIVNINAYLTGWLNNKIEIINAILAYAENPALYFTGKLLQTTLEQTARDIAAQIRIIQDININPGANAINLQNKVLDLLKTLPDSLLEFIQHITGEKILEAKFRNKFSELSDIILQAIQIGGTGRLTIVNFLELYGTLEQMIVNATTQAEENALDGADPAAVAKINLGRKVGSLFGYIAANRERGEKSAESFLRSIDFIKKEAVKLGAGGTDIVTKVDFVLEGINRYVVKRRAKFTLYNTDLNTFKRAVEEEGRGAAHANDGVVFAPDWESPQYRIPFRETLIV